MPHTAYIVEAVRTATGKKKGACGVRGERRAAPAARRASSERTPLCSRPPRGCRRRRGRVRASGRAMRLSGCVGCVSCIWDPRKLRTAAGVRARGPGGLCRRSHAQSERGTRRCTRQPAPRHQPARGAALARAKGAGWCPQTLLGAPVARGGDRRAGGRPVAPRALHQVGVGVQRRPRAAGAARGAGARPAPHAHASPQPTITSASQPLLTHARPPPTRPHARAAVPATTRQGACPTSTPPTWAPRWWMRCWTARGSTPRWWTTLFSDASRRWVGAARLARRCALVPEVAQLKTASVAA